ncbi:MAG: WXG100 family type VII secretion target [Butyrivibrio sp.]|nr:WXG100 family type VII secretion target [Butyrivibrio sp.]
MDENEFNQRLDELQVNLTRLLEIANALFDISNQIRSAASDDIGTGVEQSAGNWKGATGNVFAEKMGNLTLETINTANKLSEATQSLVAMAKEYAKAEANAMGVNINID